MKRLIPLLLILLASQTTFAQLRQTAILHPIRVTVWDEQQPEQKPAYDNFLGNAIADYLKELNGFKVTSVKMDDKEQGLPDDLLNETDVLVWWGHVRNKDVKDELAKKIVDRIKSGKLSLISLHSAHWSKPFMFAMNERATQDALSELSSKNDLSITYISPKPGVVPKRTDPLSATSTLDGNSLINTRPTLVALAYHSAGKASHLYAVTEHYVSA